MYQVSGQQILFYYSYDEILGELKLYSGYPVRTMPQDKLPAKKEEYLITGDEAEFIVSEAGRSIDKIFQIAYKLSLGVLNSVKKNELMTIGSPSVAGDPTGVDTGDSGSDTPIISGSGVVAISATFYVFGFSLNNRAAYNQNILSIVDGHIQELLISMILQKWFTVTRQVDLAGDELTRMKQLTVFYNNSLTELYKTLSPALNSGITLEVITVDPDTATIITVTPIT